jgi:heme/copper-type cytochrome/quinol oxidase subunit 3
MMKPLVAPLLPLLAVFAWLRGGWRKVAIVGLAGLAAAIAVFLPFIVTGRGVATFRTVASDLNVMPYASVNAHNLWWLAGGGWKPANVPLLGPITPTMIGLVIFGIVFGLLTMRCRDWIRATEPARGYATNVCLFAAAICSTFFFVTTHMHENHMFLTVALLTCVLGRSRALLWLTVAASLTMLANMFLHDPELPYHLPFGLSDPTSSLDHAGRPYTPLQVVGPVVNSLLAGAVTAGLCLATWKSGGAVPETAQSPATIRGLPHPGQSAR